MMSAAEQVPLSWSDRKQIERLCTHFEMCMQEGHPVTVEDMLLTAPAAIRKTLFFELLVLELDYRRANNEQSAIGTYEQRFPEHAAQVSAVFRFVNHSDATGLPSGAAAQVPEWGLAASVRCAACREVVELRPAALLDEIRCRACGFQFRVTGGTARNPLAPGDTLGQFTLLERIGEGQSGEVWKALDQRLVRVVALKIPRRDRVSDADIAALLREARAAARLRHPAIVQVYEVGHDGGSSFIVEEFIEGRDLKAWLNDAPPTPRVAAGVCATIAQALHAAHEQGVVHRDLKPANIVVDGNGAPHLTDFGLARNVDQDITFTLDGQLLGSPAYMSPEQAGGKAHFADRRADIYSLGVLLFECLTGAPPYRGNVHELIHQILQDEPPSPRRLNRTVPRELETICLKCLEKVPAQRYATAEELAADLERWLSGRPIHARAVGLPRKTIRWMTRNRLLACTLVLLALSAGLLVMVLAAANLTTNRALSREAVARQREAREREAAEDAARQASENLYLARMHLAQQAWDVGNVGLLDELLSEYVTSSEGEDLRKFEWYYYWQRAHADERTCARGEAPALWVTPSLDGTILVSAHADGNVYAWDAKRGTRAASFKAHSDDVRSARWSPDGRRLLTASSDQSVVVWDVASRTVVSRLGEFPSPVNHAVFSPDGKSIVVAVRNRPLDVWSASSGQRLRELPGHEDDVNSIECSPTGELMATVGDDSFVCLWDVKTWKRLATLEGHEAPVYAASFSPDGQVLVTGDMAGGLVVWDLAARKPRFRLERGTTIYTVCFAPDGQCFAVGGENGQVTIHDPTTGAEQLVLRGHHSAVNSLRFLPDGERLATASSDGTVKLWNLSQQRVRYDSGHSDTVWDVAFSADNRLLATCSSDRTVKIWNVENRAVIHTLEGHSADVCALEFAPRGEVLATASDDRTIRLWNARAGKTLAILRGHTDNVDGLAFSPDGKKLVSASRDGTIRVWDTSSYQLVSSFVGHADGLSALAYSFDGRYVAAAGKEGTLKVWHMAEHKLVAEKAGHVDRVFAMQFSPEGALLATAGKDGNVRLWKMPTVELVQSLKVDVDRVMGLAFSPDGTTLATAGSDARVKLWDVVSGEQRASFGEHSAKVYGVAFSGCGNLLASVAEDRQLVIRRAATAEEVRRRLATDVLLDAAEPGR